jgi:hypothetical protein
MAFVPGTTIKSALVLITSGFVSNAQGDSGIWVVRGNSSAATQCAIAPQAARHPEYPIVISEEPSKKDACLDAKAREVSDMIPAPGKCPAFTQNTIDACKTLGVSL